jgi:hypothetical protein
MAQTIPNSIPSRVTAGDTVQWQIALADFPASVGWVLKYRFINAAGKIDIISSASVDDHLVSVTATTSSGWTAGDYDYQAYVEGAGAVRHTISTGRIKVLPNLAANTTNFDNRTDARKCLDLLNEAFASYGSKAYTKEYEIAGRRMAFANPGEFLSFRSKVQQEVNREEAAARIARGESPRNKILVRF